MAGCSQSPLGSQLAKKAEVEEIVEGMIEDGANAREIAEETPLSRTTAWRRIQRYAERQVREEKKREEKKQ